MIKFYKILVIVVAIFIVINNYQNGIDKRYPLMQLGVTFIWMVACFLMYVAINNEQKSKPKN